MKTECVDKAFYAFGTAAIFSQRADKLRKFRSYLLFFGIISPILLGASVASFGTGSWLVVLLLPVTGLCTVIQLCFSGWALVHKWDERFEYAIESAQANNELFTEFELLAKKDLPADSEKLIVLFERNRAQEAKDMKAGITQEEKHFAMRSSLVQFRRVCVGCRQMPISLKPSNCDICGNFKEKK